MTRTADLPSYESIRQTLVAAQAKVGPTPCLRGKAECCDRTVGLSRADAALLLHSLANGEIPDSVRERAVTNNLDRQSDRCPFLGDSRECTIYPFRPLICLAWGIGGRARPDTAAALSRRKQLQEKSGIEQSVDVEEIACYACPSCLAELRHERRQYPLELIEAVTTAYVYLHADDEVGSRLTNFVKKHLGREQKRVSARRLGPAEKSGKPQRPDSQPRTRRS
jgi:hypothetical protein